MTHPRILALNSVGGLPERLDVVCFIQLEFDANTYGPTKMAIEEFDEATKQRLIEEDREAWNSICTILLSIISIGLVLACLAVWLVSS